MTSVLRDKRLLILGGMRISCEIVRKAQEMGVYTIVADYNRVADSPAKQIADEAVELNVTDIDAVVSYVKNHEIDGIIVGFNDMLLPYYAEICEKSGLPCYGTKDQFLILTNKKRIKALYRQFDLPVIPDYNPDSDNILFPVIVKPVDSSGSRGITICYDRTELEPALETAQRASKTGEVIIERYMDKQEVTVFWTFQDGYYFLSALGNRHVRQNQGMDIIPLPVGYTFPSVFLSKFRTKFENNCKKLFRHLGIKDGMMFMQCKVDDGICYVYDLGYRLTGSLEYKILERVCGYNPLEMMICHALTGKMGNESIVDKAIPEFNIPAFNLSCLCAPGTIENIMGIEEVMSYPEVEDVVLAHVPGDTITESMRGLLSQITVRVIGSVQNKEYLMPVIRKIEKTIQVVGKDGKQLLLPGLGNSDIMAMVI